MIKLTLKAQAAEEDIKSYNYEFDQPIVTLGRLKENDIQLPHSTVSGFHAQIIKEEENYYLVDRGSINGTFLNNQRLLAGEKNCSRMATQSGFNLSNFTSPAALRPCRSIRAQRFKLRVKWSWTSWARGSRSKNHESS